MTLGFAVQRGQTISEPQLAKANTRQTCCSPIIDFSRRNRFIAMVEAPPSLTSTPPAIPTRLGLTFISITFQHAMVMYHQMVKTC
jgi:hypothetical protein